MLHTHVVGKNLQIHSKLVLSFIILGRKLTLHQYRMNEECGVLEEIAPIDQNLNYDFNFQQIVHFQNERVILPVSSAKEGWAKASYI